MTTPTRNSNKKTYRNVTLRRRNAAPLKRARRTSGGLKKYLKQQLRIRRASIESSSRRSSSSSSSSSSSASSPTGLCVLVDIVNAEICTAEFASWTLLDTDMGNDSFLEECMQLFSMWCALLTEDTVATDHTTAPSLPLSDCESWREDNSYAYRVCTCCADDEDEDMAIADDDEDVEEVIVEPVEMPLTVALISSAKDLLPAPSAVVLRALSFPTDVLMTSLAALLFETRHLQYINHRLPALPAPPNWMIRETDPPNSLVSTVSLPSGWDAVSARVSSSSIFNLFSDPTLSSRSLDTDLSIDTLSSTVSVPASFWDPTTTTPTVSVTTVAPVPPLIPERVTSSTCSSISSLFTTNSSISSLFKDPSSAHSSASIFSIDPSGCSSSTSTQLSSYSSGSLPSVCAACQQCHDDEDDSEESEDTSVDYEEDADSDDGAGRGICYRDDSESESAKSDRDTSSDSSGSSLSENVLSHFKFGRPKVLPNGRIQYNSMFVDDSDYSSSDSEAEEPTPESDHGIAHWPSYPLYSPDSTSSDSSVDPDSGTAPVCDSFCSECGVCHHDDDESEKSETANDSGMCATCVCSSCRVYREAGAETPEAQKDVVVVTPDVVTAHTDSSSESSVDVEERHSGSSVESPLSFLLGRPKVLANGRFLYNSMFVDDSDDYSDDSDESESSDSEVDYEERHSGSSVENFYPIRPRLENADDSYDSDYSDEDEPNPDSGVAHWPRYDPLYSSCCSSSASSTSVSEVDYEERHSGSSVENFYPLRPRMVDTDDDSDDEIAPLLRGPYNLFSAADSCDSTVSSASSGYGSEVDSDEPAVVLLKATTTTTTSTQTEAHTETESEVARILAEYDSIIDKLVAMRKELDEFLDKNEKK